MHADVAPIRTSRIIQRTPFFYGWVILVVGTLGNIMTSPGQTYAISIFIEHFIADLGVSRSLVSTFYTIGTLTGSFVLPFVGRQVDQRSPRLMVGLIAGLFGLACLYMSTVQTGWMLLIGFILVRMLGQGSLGLVSTYIVNQWWLRRRGLMMGLSGVMMALLGVGTFPSLINWLIPWFGWRTTYALLGAALLLVMVPVGVIFFRARPELYGLLPDGLQPQTAHGSHTAHGPHPAGSVIVEENWTAEEATRTAAFWIIAAGLASISMLSTGLMFHMVSIFADNQLSATAAAAVYVPIAITTAFANLGSGFLVDKVPVRFMLMTALLLEALALWMAPSLDGVTLAVLYGVVLGVLGGLMRTLSTVVYATFFGRRHLGAISGISSTVLVAASALGPLPMGLARDLLGEYNQALYLLSLLPLGLAVLALFMRRPHKPATEPRRA